MPRRSLAQLTTYFLSLFRPPFSSRLLCDLRPLFLGQAGSTRLAAFAAKFGGCLVALVLCGIVNLPSSDIANELRELDGIAWAFEALGCHGLLQLNSMLAPDS